MKKVMIMCVALMISAGVIASPGVSPEKANPPVSHPITPPRYHRPVTRIFVTPSFGYYWGSPFYNPYWGFGYPYYNYPYYGPYRQSALTTEINSIKESYRLQIKQERRDKTISKAERKVNISNLKNERDEAIINAQKNYYLKQNNNSSEQSNSSNPSDDK